MTRAFMRQAVHPLDDAPSAGHTQADAGDDEAPTQAQPMAAQDNPEADPESPSEQANAKPVLTTVGSRRKVNGMTDGSGVQDDSDAGAAEDAAGSEDPAWSRAKAGRRLTFADEGGEALAEINYSTRTHYSKQPVPGSASGQPRACCVIQ